MKKLPRIVFLGSGHFALPLLEGLLESGFSPLVITKPDKPAHRGKQLSATPLKELAVRLGLAVWQPDSLKEALFTKQLASQNLDLLISAAFGGHIPLEILKLPRRGAINVHPSLLPKYRGAAPAQRALMNGEKKTGITLVYLVEEWDAGDILLQETHPIDPEDTAGTLLEKLSLHGASMLKKVVPELLEKKIPGKPQNPAEVTLAPKIKDEETWISWNKPAEQIINLVRGLAPSPTARTCWKGMLMKIYKGKMAEGASGIPGTVIRIEKEGPVINAGKDAVLLLEVLPENRKLMTGKDFANGFRLQTGEKFEG